MQTLFTVFLALHAAIHLIGFMKWGVAHENPQLSVAGLSLGPAPMRKAYGAVWLVCLVLLSTAAVTHAAGVTLWWVPALLGATLSQVLVFTAWSEAKYGTVANVVVLLAVIFSVAGRGFERRITDDARRVLGSDSRASDYKVAGQLRRTPRLSSSLR